MIKAICFDLGDTLTPQENIIRTDAGLPITAKVVEGAFEVLGAIRQGGYKTAIISNSKKISDSKNNSARIIIKMTGLQHYFDAIIISEEVGIEKPCRGIFEAALNQLKVKPENTVMVGDSIDADIVGANRIGMKSVWFKKEIVDDIVDDEEKKPDFRINRMCDLLGILGLNQERGQH